MQHANSPLTPKGRHRMVLLVEEERLTFEAAAAASNVAKSTCWEWVRRWRLATAAERRSLACLADRSSRPRSSPAQVPDEEAQKICERREKTGWSPRRLADEPDIARPHSTVHRVLRRGGCSRRPRPEPPAVIRYEWPCPGNLLHMDVKKLERLEVARAWGATHTISVEDHPDPAERLELIQGIAGRTGASVAFELSGARGAAAEGLPMLRPHGRYLISGTIGGAAQEIDVSTITTRGLRVRGSMSGDIDSYYKAMEFLCAHRDRFAWDLMLGRTYGLDRIADALTAMKRMDEIKPVVDPTLETRSSDRVESPIKPPLDCD